MLWPRRDNLRSLALRAGSGPQARRFEEWRAVQGLGLAFRHGQNPPQARRLRRRRSADAVLDTKANLDKARITNQDAALRAAAEQAFYNTSKFTLRDLRNRGSQQQLRADFEAYLDGFSPNVQEILENLNSEIKPRA